MHGRNKGGWARKENKVRVSAPKLNGPWVTLTVPMAAECLISRHFSKSGPCFCFLCPDRGIVCMLFVCFSAKVLKKYWTECHGSWWRRTSSVFNWVIASVLVESPSSFWWELHRTKIYRCLPAWKIYSKKKLGGKGNLYGRFSLHLILHCFKQTVGKVSWFKTSGHVVLISLWPQLWVFSLQNLHIYIYVCI